MSKLGVLAGWMGIALVVNAAPVQQVWEARYNGPLNREDLFSAMTIDAAGRVYVTGSSDNNANPDPYATVKYDTNGVQMWVSRYTGPRQVDVPIAIAVDNAGNVYVTGFSHGTVHNYDPDYATVKYAPDGTELWAARYNAHTNAVSSADNPRAMVVNNAGEVYVTGASASPQGSMDFLTIKYSTTGSELWVQRYDGPAHGEDAARAMGIDAGGNVYVCGSSPGIQGTWDVTLVKYSPDGTQVWVSRFETEIFDRLDELAMAVDAAGNSYISVFTKQPGPGWVWRLNLLKYDANGGLVWKTQRRTVSEDEFINIAAMELDDANNVCIAGTVNSGGASDYLTMKFSSSGEELWSSRYNSGLGNSGNEDSARDIAIDGEGNIYVTGLSYFDNGYQFSTVKYRPNGHRDWVTTTSLLGNTGTSLSSVRVDGSANVYVSGSAGPGGSRDYYTVKYKQLAQPGAPVIVSPPAPQTVAAGGTATFTVSASGTAPLSYQWRRNGQIIPGGTNSTLVLSNLAYLAHGQYSVDVTNSAGATASPEALLNVLTVPFIIDQSTSRAVLAGATVDFFVIAGGSEPFSYQWKRDGVAIPGATNATLILSNVQTADIGSYRVEVSNVVGSTNSAVIQLRLAPGVEQSFLAGSRYPGDYYTFPQTMRLDAQGRAYVAQTAYTETSQYSQFYTVLFDTNGAVLWSARFAAGANTVNNVSSSALDSSGNFYVAGSSGDYQSGRIVVVKYNATGSQLWAAIHQTVSNRFDQATAIALDSSGNVYVTGSTDREDSPQHFLTLKLDSNGVEVWAAEYRSSPASTDIANDIQVDAGGAIYVFGTSLEQTFDLTTIRYAPDGEIDWVRRQPAGSQGVAGALKLDSLGNVIVTGAAAETGYDSDYLTLKYDPNGNLLWLAQYHGFLDGYDVPYSMAIDSSNNVYVAGYSGLSGQQNTDVSGFATVKYDANGNELWVASRIDQASYGGRDSLAVDANGNVYTTFSKNFPLTGADFATYKYDSEGTRVWTAVSGRIGSSGEFASSVAVDPEGHVLVSGIGYPSPPSISEVLLAKYKDRPAPGLPVITQGPQSRDIPVGTTVTFTVAATGDSPLTYQWYLNSSEIGGATDVSYTIQSAGTNNAGHYAVEVRNNVGSVLSRSAALTISVPPAIVRQPAGHSVLIGADVLLEVAASGTRPLLYQWRLNGTNIPDANAAVLRLANVQVTDGGEYSVVVSNRVGTATSAGAVVTVNQNARREWLVLLAPGDTIHAHPVDIEVDAAGNVYVTGYTEGTPQRYITAKYNSAGEQLWVSYFGAPGGASARALAVDDTGNSYVTGYSWDLNGLNGFATVKYGPNGNQIWAQEFRPPGNAQGRDISIGADGYIYVTGDSGGPTGGVTTIKYNTNGAQQWIATYGGASGQGRRVVADAAGNVYVLGLVYASVVEAVVIKYNSAGTRMWANVYGGLGNDDPIDLKLDSQGNVIASVNVSMWDGRIATVKYNPAGVLQWTSRFGYGHGDETPRAIVLDSQDNIYITGRALVGSSYDEQIGYFPDYDLFTLKYNSAGTLQWSARYGDNRADEGIDLALDGHGGLYVTGRSTGEDSANNMIVLRYDTNGTRYWVDVVSGDVGSTAYGVAVRTAGTNCVYAAGVAVIAGYEKIALLKYTHNDVPGLPVITSAPQNQSVIAGDTATFSVAAAGSSPLHYQWYFNHAAIPGANGSALVISHAETTNAGTYSVEVSNPAGLAASSDAFLTVHLPARITRGPEDQCVVAGSHVVFHVEYEGEDNVDVRWFYNGAPVTSAAGSSVLSIPSVGPTNTGVYSVTVSNEFGSMTASARLMITPQATLAWDRDFNAGPGSTYDQPIAAVVDPAGNVYVTGSGSLGFQTVKFDTNGTALWARSYEGTNGHSQANAIALGPDGSVYVAGAIGGANNDQDFATVKYDANGNQLWAATYDYGGYDQAFALAVDADGNAYVTGSGSTAPYSTVDAITIKYDNAGTQLWIATYDGPDGGEDVPAAITVDSAGNVYVTGYTMEANTIAYYQIADYVTIKYNPDGEQLWAALHDGPSTADDRAKAIAVDPAGNVYVTGFHSYNYSVNSGTTVYYDYDYATIKYNPDGQQLWLAVYSGKRPSPDTPTDLKLDGAGNVYVTGTSENTIVTVKYDNTGHEQWVARVDSGAYYDQFIKLALSRAAGASPSDPLAAAEAIYVTGQSDYGDILTFKLDSNGTRQWLARYDGPAGQTGGYEYPVGLGTDTAGNVYVAGSVDTSTTGRDFVILKYAVSSAPGAPVITSPPHNVTAPYATTATFTVTATGDAPLQFQWRRNGLAIAGATNAALQLPDVSAADVARYSVLVYNQIDCVLSAEVSLTVSAPETVQCTAIQRLQNGAIRLVVVGPSSWHYRIEATADFHTWTTVGTVYNSGGTCEYIEPPTSLTTRRFYRVIKEP